MSDHDPDWILGIDIGTSNTAAAHTTDSGDVEALPLTHTGNLMSSAVFVESARQIRTGAAALNQARAQPRFFIASPKRLLTHGDVPVDSADGQVRLVTVFAAVIATVLERARARHNDSAPSLVVLTHPESWAPEQISVLVAAAEEAGVRPEAVRTLSEPVAAAQYYSRRHEGPDGRLAVFDFGGGTLDVAVLAAAPGGDGFSVVATRGDAGLGGRTFDAVLRAWALEQLEHDDPDLADDIRQASPGERLRNDQAIGEAKELLSDTPSASLTLVAGDGRAATLQVTRDEFELLAEPFVDRAVAITQEAIDAAGEHVQAVYLTGGSSQIPLVHNRLRSVAPPARIDDPKTVVARGAVAAHRVDRAAGVVSAESVTPRIDSARDAGSSQRTLWWVAGVVALIAAVVVGVLVIGRHRHADGAAEPAPPVAAPEVLIPATTEAQIRAALPVQLADALEDCEEEDFTENKGVEFRCRIDVEDPVISGLTRAANTTRIYVAVDVAQARNEVVRARTTGSDGNELMENSARTATAVITPYSELAGTSLRKYANNTTGVIINMDSFRDTASARAFLARAGLMD